MQIAASLFAREITLSIDRSVERARPTVLTIRSLVSEKRKKEKKREGRVLILLSVLDLEFRLIRRAEEVALSLLRITSSKSFKFTCMNSQKSREEFPSIYV